MNNFFNSLEYITLLEASMCNGNSSATQYKLNSKTRLLLGEREGTLKAENVLTNKLYIERLALVIIETIKNNKSLKFKEVLMLSGITYHNYKHYFNDEQKQQINKYKP